MTDESWRGKVGRLQSDEIEAFLAEPHIARLACLDEEGWPYWCRVWHEWDGESFWVIPRKRSAWAGTCSATVAAPSPSTRRAGSARSSRSAAPSSSRSRTSVAAGSPIAERMSTRYLGENGPKYLEPTLDKPRWLFRLEPVKVQTWQGQDWADRYK